MTTTMLSTIESVNELLDGTTIAPIALPRKARKADPTIVINGETTQEFKDRLATMPAKARASKGQMRNVNRKRKAAQMRTYATLAAFRKDFPTMRSAAIEYRILSA